MIVGSAPAGKFAATEKTFRCLSLEKLLVYATKRIHMFPQFTFKDIVKRLREKLVSDFLQGKDLPIK